MPYKYQNGKWTYVPENATGGKPSRPSGGGGGSSSHSSSHRPAPKQPISPPPKIPKYNDNRKTTETKTHSDKKFIEEEVNTLEGDITVTTPKPKLKAKGTVKLTGVGKALSGLYYVEKVTNTFDNNGYTQTISVSKTGFGDSLKPGNVSKPGVDDVGSHANRPKPIEGGSKKKINPPQRRTVISTQQVRNAPSSSAKRVGEVYPGGWLECYEQENGWYKMWFITFKRYGSKKLHAWVPCNKTKPI